ncbi:hypothetical protein QR680_010580 [Steinernema hermaphroditum]|uniref:Uncharacterized protein n=1 Tax=Steinernema hermaphroditum TaxID=289476 RepID=A0AA39IRB4_9BILA|nr:hypothetical protein QR680_010580 [Steinernema hermaphroditum]
MDRIQSQQIQWTFDFALLRPWSGTHSFITTFLSYCCFTDAAPGPWTHLFDADGSSKAAQTPLFLKRREEKMFSPSFLEEVLDLHPQ